MEKVTVPEGQSGDWRVERFTVTQKDVERQAMRAAFGHCRFVPQGTYTRLMRGNQVVMSDTPDEMRDHWCAVHHARGSVLINGLGLGMVAQAILAKPEVTEVTVVETSEDVIQLVAPHYKDPRLTVVHADAFTFQPPKGKRYGAVWHDIWDEITPENLPEMARLHRRYGRRTDWQGSWARGLCERQAKAWGYM